MNAIFQNMIYLLPAIIVALVLHEWAHALAAYILGDRSIKQRGRLSFNPLKHIDPIGFLTLLIFQFGWAKPVGINTSKFKNPKLSMAFIALAGPLMNFVLSFVAILCFVLCIHFGVYTTAIGDYFTTFFNYLGVISLSLCIFNLIPLPPLDGSKVLFAFLDDESYFSFISNTKYSMILLIILIFSGVLSNGLSNINTDIIQSMISLITNFIV